MEFNNITILIYLLFIFLFILIFALIDDIKKKNKSKEINKFYIPEKEKSLVKQLVNSCYIGIIRGIVIGYIITDTKQSILNGALYGLTNPIILFVQNKYFNNNDL